MPEQKVQTSAGMETPSETVARVKAQMAANPSSATSPVDPIVDALTQRLTQQGKGISSSATSNLQDSINQAINQTQVSGNLETQRLQSEKDRELGYASETASNTLTNAMESQGGYAMQATALHALTDSTDKSVRDLNKRYEELILANDSATAKSVSDLIVKKLEFQQTQEQNYYQNLFALGNLQETAISRAQQSEQFWAKQEQDQTHFEAQLKQSKYEFDQNYAVQLQDLKIKQGQLEIARSNNALSWQEYALKKAQLNKDNTMVNTQAIIAQDIKSKLQTGKVTKEQLLSPEYLQHIIGATGYTGKLEELSAAVNGAYETVTNNRDFMDSLNKPQTGGNSGSFWDVFTKPNTPEASAQSAKNRDALGNYFSKVFSSGGGFSISG